MNNEKTRYDYLPFSKQIADSFCALPFAQLVFTPSGRVAPCCLIQDFYVGDVQTRSVDEIWNGNEIKSLRHEFLTGKIHTCKMLQEHKQCHRQHDRLLPHISPQEHCEKKPARLDLRLNSSCQMCQTWRGSNNTYIENNFIKNFETELLPYAKEINMLGGEKKKKKSTFEILKIASKVNPSCLWAFSTNLNIDVNLALSHLEKIRISRIQVSIDSLEEKTYQKIRKGGSLKVLLGNLDKLIKFRETYKNRTGENFRLQGAMCIQRDNWREIPQFLDFCHDKGLNANLQFAYTPVSVTLSLLDRREKDEIIDYLLDYAEGDKAIYLKPILAALADDASALQLEE